MNDPQRLIESGDSAVVGLLSVARRPRALPAELARRSAARVARIPARSALLRLGLVTGGGLLIAGAAALLLQGSPRIEGPASLPPVVASEAPRGEVPAPSGVLEGPAAPALPAALPHPRRSPPPAADNLAEEVASLDRIRARLAADPDAALSAITEHERRFTRAKLPLECELLRIQALDRAGRSEEAKGRARAMLAHAPGTLYETKLRQILGE